MITPEGRGPDGWYYDYAGADTFEVWADVAAHYKLDPAWTAIAGYSMGGYGTYKFATQFPDLFAKAQPTVGPPALGTWAPPSDPQPGGARSNTNRMLGSVRNIPFLMWNAAQDELVPVAERAGAGGQPSTTLGYRYEFDLFNPAEHLTLAINDEYGPAAAFLGDDAVDRNPPHVTYVYNPTMDFPGVQHDGRSRLLGVGPGAARRSSGTAPLGTIDVRSRGFGVGDPDAVRHRHGRRHAHGRRLARDSVHEPGRRRGGAPRATPVEDRLDINATNISTVTIDAARAKVTCDAQLNITSDGPLNVNMVNCPSYARPKGATPLYASLVPAYDAVHSAQPPARAAACLWLVQPAAAGLRPAHGRDARRERPAAELDRLGQVRRRAPGRADVQVDGLDHRRSQAERPLRLHRRAEVSPSVRITDRNNGPSGTEPATDQDSPFPMTASCVATTSTSIGGPCSLSSSFNAVVPGAVVQGKRAIWELGRRGLRRRHRRPRVHRAATRCSCARAYSFPDSRGHHLHFRWPDVRRLAVSPRRHRRPGAVRRDGARVRGNARGPACRLRRALRRGRLRGAGVRLPALRRQRG